MSGHDPVAEGPVAEGPVAEGPVAEGNTAMRDAWDGDQGAFWADYADHFDAGPVAYQPVLLEAAAVRSGETVLDVGCGAGRTSLDLAPIAAPGQVTGVDLSTRMLAIARQRAVEEGLTNVAFERADAQVHPFPAGATDVVVSRHGSMFFADPVAAFANLARTLRPGGRMVLLTWQGIEHQEWMRAPMTILAAGRDLPLPPPDTPGPLSLADPDRVRSVLEAAGFTDVELVGHALPMVFGADPDDALDFVARHQGWQLRGLEPAARERALAELHADLVVHDGPAGVQYGSACWIVRARRP